MSIDRRNFLKGAMVAGGSAALIGMSGCSAPTKKEDKSEQKQSAFDAAAAPIDPVSPPEKWNKNADIVVVGSGGGGMTASIRLADAGYKVILIEKSPETGGASHCSSMFVNFGGHRLAEEVKWAYPSYPYDVDNIVEYLMDIQQMSGDPKLLRALVVQGPKCIDWMSDSLGVPWAPTSKSDPSFARILIWEGMRTPKNPVNTNTHTFEYLTEMAKKKGVEILLNTAATNLVKDNDTIIGVKAQDPSGDVYIQGKRAVILTAGGFAMNRALLKKYIPIGYEGIPNCCVPPSDTGEVTRMALGVGADMSGLNSAACYDGGVDWGTTNEEDTTITTHFLWDGITQLVRQPWLLINNKGERLPYISSNGLGYPYTPKSEGIYYPTGLTDQAAVEMAQPGGRAYVCFDSKYPDYISNNSFNQSACRVARDIPDDDPYIARVPKEYQHWQVGVETALEAGALKKCDTIEELEKALGLRKNTLTENVKKWNEACSKGEDWVDNYKYDPSWLIPIDKPPYYGAKIGGNIFCTKAGVRVNEKLQVISTDGAVIPGLFAGFHTAGGSNGEGNIAGKPFAGIYGDIGLSFVGGYMAAGAILEEDKKV